MSSTRLPGKVLLPILGRPMLMRQFERLRRCRELDRLVVATSTDPSDDPIVTTCLDAGVPSFRGSISDVLGRFLEAARPYRPAIVVRLTADCPLADPSVIDRVVRSFEAGDCDYASNTMVRTFPRGLDVEVMRYDCLEEAAREAVLPAHREHVTPFLRAHPERFRLKNMSDKVDRSGLRWTVDEPDDFEFVRLVYERLYPANADFTTLDVLKLIEGEPAIQAINAGVLQKTVSTATE
jgi:spore coat polysaccharide biosynthesis protein SpsF (cytidylyltransferase family)